ncbi:PRC-barrel domain-containing protein [Nitrosomonas sp.]|uniref:PRC-barrel domain-containing protein n=1 Tax=Nitrosomonas sp. TaxID=42353 RepID=UPI002845728C|nr:PRC-barrel domain-containing protein [Nitrosomonas sp.]MDR4513242.1 PRC-barrel domain-containing protein [Nitrosomonas sp.]
MPNSRLIMLLGATVLSISVAVSAEESTGSSYAAKEVEFGGANLKYRVDKNAAKMIGKDVVNQDGEEIGSVENMLITDTDNVQYAIVSVGGFLGIGDKLVAVPTNNLQFDKDQENVTLKNITKEALESAPGFDYARSGIEDRRFPQYGPDQH